MRTFVTTTIPYVNASPHVGFALELVQADFIARYRRLIGEEVRFQTGTDENSQKNVIAAREKGMTPEAWVDLCSAEFRSLAEALGLSHDDFVRTTEKRHQAAVHELIGKLAPEDLYTKEYTGLYCVGCEDFWQESDLVDGKCPDHKVPPKVVSETNHFFRLSKYQAELQRRLESGEILVCPPVRKAEIMAFLGRGLEDISISRDSARSAGWGVPFPGDGSQVLYVWIDALVNYVTGPGLGQRPDWAQWWSDEAEIIHVLGKNVWKFHALYWPALLLSAGLALPDKLVIHGFLTVEGEKISKSLGNAVSPLPLIQRFGSDGLRYYLLKAFSLGGDGDFTEAGLGQAYQQHLANGLGNQLSRLTKLAAPLDLRLELAERPEIDPAFHEAMARFDLPAALSVLDAEVLRLNREIDTEKPWELPKKGESEKLRVLLSAWLKSLYAVAFWMQPAIPQAAARALETLRQAPLTASGPLFPRVA
jgi:methionyl-tRNA synthetase